MKQIDVSIVIVNYNARDYLRRCLRSILDTFTEEVHYEILVVDNASHDDSAEMVKKEFAKSVELIDSTENVGFSRGNNLAIKQAKGRYLLFLNPDTEMKKGTLERMVSFMDSHSDAGAATCFVRMSDGSIDDGSHRGFPTPWNSLTYFTGISKLFPKSQFFNGYNLGWCDMDLVHEIDALVGAFMLVRREAGEDVGWWDEDYFFYGEDLDFCYTLKEKKWKIFFIPDVEILHHKGVSGGIKEHSKKLSTADITTKRRATTERFRAMRTFYSKHYMRKYPKFITALVFAAIQVKLALSLRKL